MAYKNDPRKITAKFNSSCSKCQCKIKKNESIYYWPSSREAFCLKCGEEPFRQFKLSVQDEDAYNRSYANGCY